jgi:hypothetical protein
MSKTTLQLDLEDVLGNPLDDHSVRMDVFSLDNMRHFQAVIPLSGQQQVNVALADCPGGVYRIELTATNYRMLQFFLRLEEGETARRDPLKFPVNPALVTGIDAPAFSALDDGLQRLLNSSAFHNEAGSNLYDSLPDLLKACLLNIFVKASATTLDDGSNTFHHFDEITNFVQDRLFIRTTSALFEETAVSGKFHRVPFALHTVPLPFQMFDSFKTRDAHGNLQLTFARTPDNQYLVDVDIDEAQGIEHVFEVVRNSVAGLTNPYNVREILCEAQGLSPLYSFAFAERGIAVVAAGASQ